MSAPLPKRRKIDPESQPMAVEEKDKDVVAKLIVQFTSTDGIPAGPQLEIPSASTPQQLQELINSLLQNKDIQPYAFYVNNQEILGSLVRTLEAQTGASYSEGVTPVVFQPQAVFRVRPVTRCSADLPGHTEAVLHVSFSSDGKSLASGSGDATVRLWDLSTATPKATLRGHTNWVLAVAWSPDGTMIASGGMDATVRVWDSKTGKRKGKILRGHKKWLTTVAWEPLHRNVDCTRLASASKDGMVKIWDVRRGVCVFSLSGHTGAVKHMVWGGDGLLFSASQDRTINVWSADTGKLVRTLKGHAHWVNTLALNTGYALRMGACDPATGQTPSTREEIQAAALKRFEEAKKVAGGKELLVSGSDDFTMFLWNPAAAKRSIARLTGHQQPVNFVAFSPNGLYIASASFDNSVRLWNGVTGQFVAAFRGHVQSVYQVCWSSDSRLLCSSSKDSTLKVWDIRTKKLKMDLPGHADEVFAVDWSPNGDFVASGGKDRVLRLWRS